MTRIDIDQLRKEIRSMNRWNVLYRALKEELSALKHWKDRPRGNPSKGGKMAMKKRKVTA
jgi:hypothetical protein